jgi:DNA-binding transcriptional regulator LsrR (DeoR family)
MARLNISIPGDLYQATLRWRGTRNLSGICATALRRELEAADSSRSILGLEALLRPKSEEERDLAQAFRLADACIVDAPQAAGELRTSLGKAGADYLDRWLCDDALFAITGGRQIWEVVRQLAPRSIRVAITALGIAQNDPRVLHVHPNTLTTILWLLYSPSATAQLITTPSWVSPWPDNPAPAPRPRYFVLSSCGPFAAASPFATLLGDQTRDKLLSKGATGDFAYIFFSADDKLLEFTDLEPPLPTFNRSLFSARSVQRLASRSDARVILVAGGKEKLPIIKRVLRHNLCNVLITDQDSAAELLTTAT